MKDLVVGMVLCAFSLGLAVLLGVGTREVWRDHDREQDAANWQTTTGRLDSISIVETLDDATWQYRIECEYSYEVGGTRQRSTVFDLHNPYFGSPVSAILFIESAINAHEVLTWTPTRRGSLGAWVAAPLPREVTVRHSARYPDAATLTTRLPMPSAFSWALILVMAGLTAIFALATAAFAIMPFVRESVPGAAPGEAGPRDGGP